jgi:hypothetical protein
MWGMWSRGFWERGTQREEQEQWNRCKEPREASSREEETLRNYQRQAKGSSEENCKNILNTIKRDTKKRADVYSDANPLASGSKKPRRETTKGEEACVSNPGGVEVAQKADEDDEDQQGFNRALFQTCSKGDAATDARIQKLEQELHILEEELKNENHLLWKEDEKAYTDVVHSTTREVTTRASGKYLVR